MNMKKWTALLAALALVLCVLAGCGGSRALTSVLLDLLEGQYTNVQVETDPELERALRRAAADGGDTADILARLKNELNLTGGTLSLSRLGDGQQGEHAVELRFEAGSDPDAAARRVFVTWNGVFGGLPRDGQYAAAIAMIEAENGYYIAVDVNVVRAGAQHDDSDDEPEEPYTDDGNGNYTVNTSDGLKKLFEEKNENDFENKTITLQAGKTYIVEEQLAETFKGTLDGKDANVTLTGGSGLFGQIGPFGQIGDGSNTIGAVKNLNINVTGNINGSAIDNSSSQNAGAVAGTNWGTISNCNVMIESSGSISASFDEDKNSYVCAGAVVGENYSTISGCTVTIESGGRISASANIDDNKGNARAGGVAGDNNGGSISDCTVTIERGSSIRADGTGTAYAGGVVGSNSTFSSITGCTVKIASDSIKANGGSGSSYAGSVVGYKNNKSTVEGNTVEDSNDPELPEIGNQS